MFTHLKMNSQSIVYVVIVIAFFVWFLLPTVQEKIIDEVYEDNEVQLDTVAQAQAPVLQLFSQDKSSFIAYDDATGCPKADFDNYGVAIILDDVGKQPGGTRNCFMTSSAW